MLQQKQLQWGKNTVAALPPEDHADLQMIFGMRLLLAVMALLTLMIDSGHQGMAGQFAPVMLSLYLLYGAALLVLLHFHRGNGKRVYWLDAGWCGLIVWCTGGGESYFFPYFFFAILASSFQRGRDEGTRITLASCALLVLASVLSEQEPNLPLLLLRTAFVMALGTMIACWGGLSVQHKRRLALLREVSQQSNPRFGVDHTVASMLEKARVFFGASSCILVMREGGAAHWQLRTALDDSRGNGGRVSQMSEAAVAPLMVFEASQSVLYASSLRSRLGLGPAWQGKARASATWQRLDLDATQGTALTELFDAQSFISVPLPLHKGQGRLYVLAATDRLSKADATFLAQIVEQVFPQIENIAILDKLASGAAYRERQKIARDLHDSTIQPYIGLRHGLSALRAKVAAGNPLLGDLDKLIEMSGQVIGDLRQMAQTVRGGQERHDEPELLAALRRQAQQLKKFFGIDIEIVSERAFVLSDRLAAEVFQIVNEGMSNIRRHTTAREGCVRLACGTHAVSISIENTAESEASRRAPFMPASIAERALALGGTVQVGQAAGGATAVRIEIPV
ncbi:MULTISPECIES: sensor histidine kinase [unclassified Janthinobacterium]|uniref:sensor histidine kinase n=1 Tax=unclassified Janthinobacterium TaxID=2610881 RepID=UPI000C110C55|nr:MULTISPECIES: histidine kinase [unclassified Janthinobacterium]MDZ5635147.1 histidine kinase [Janthinobacterium sp. GMG1]PHV25187.1 histidine kinase [Janthinobacterium sp. BJB426]